MSLLKNALKLLYQGWPIRASKGDFGNGRWRHCRIEKIESRQMLSITGPEIQIGAVYFEDAQGQDQVGDLLEITFSGGAAGTQLTELRIDTDKLGDGLTIGDTFFDTATGGMGAFGSTPFTIISQSGIDSVIANVTDGGTLLVLNFNGFNAGEKLVFGIDVDEQGFLGPNAVAEGNEFEGSKLFAVFTAPHYYSAEGMDIFYDAFDSKLSGTGLDLPNDNYSPPSPYMPPGAEPGPVYTAGAIFPLEQQPLPITISGNVFEDLNRDNNRDPGEPGIAGVSLALYSLGFEGYAATGISIVTDATGHYSFEGLLPDIYQIVETQPEDYLSVGAIPGTVGGATRGSVATVDILSSINLEGGDDSINNDFAETRAASISGFVYHDANNDGVFDPSETGISGVTVMLLNGDGTPTGLITVTDFNGIYKFDDLYPGTYSLAEEQPAGYFDGLDTAGTAGGAALNPGDFIGDIPLAGGVKAKNYNFGEMLPASISGRVHADLDQNCLYDLGEPLLAGVTIYLLDAEGNHIVVTQTDENGEYFFTELLPGVYGVEEIQPAGYFEGSAHVGSVGGDLDGVDRIINVGLGSGVNGVHYDFCE
ncbi:MAG TPA: SdrD B-like domain-containing protein, partial [Thermoguttaceae bacterium]